MDKRKRTFLEDQIDEQKFLNSFLDSEIDIAGYIGGEIDDPFSFPKQKILEDILKETE